MKKIFLLSLMALLLGASTETFGQGHGNRGGRWHDRSDRQRIRRGIRSGQITRDEARALRVQQRNIRSERRGYRSDGSYTRSERREIRRDERGQNRLIRRYRRNDDRRGNGYYRRGAGSPGHPVFGRRNRY